MQPFRFLTLFILLLLTAPATAWSEYQTKGKRDPFVPLVTPEGQRIHPPGLDEEVATGLSSVVLQGIVFDPQAESYAVINGRIVREREEVEGIKVLRIEPTKVTVLVEGKPHELILRQLKEEAETP